MTPSDIANEALNSTLEAVQPLMKRCMKLKESDPTALIFSDEIARRVAKDLKLYGGAATLFSPQLLSCAAVIRQHSKAGAFVSLPDWNSVVDNDPRIKTHPQFHKTVGYCPPPPAYPNAELEPSMSSSTVPVEPNSTRGTLVIASKAPDLIQSLHVVPEVQPSIAELLPPAAPVAEPLISAPMTVVQNVNGNVRSVRQGNTPTCQPQKRKLETNGSEPEPSSVPRKPVEKRRRKFASDEEGNGATGTIHVKVTFRALLCLLLMALSVKARNAVAPTATSPSKIVDERGFWDAESRPVGWGLDATVATAVEVGKRPHLIAYRLTYYSIPFAIILGNATNALKWMCDALFCRTRSSGVGIRQRLQAKAQKAVIKSSVDPEVKRSRTHAPKSRTAVKTPVLKVVFENPPIGHQRNTQSFRSLQLPPVDVPAPLKSSMAPTPSEPEPTARDILQSIQDLGRRFDLLATDERVDALHVRLDSVERRISLRLTALEEEFSVSNAHRENYLYAHGPRAHSTTYAPQYPPEPTIASWPKHNHAGDEPLGISTIGREYTHAWDLHDEAPTSTSSWWQTNSLDPPYIRKASIASSPLSSTSPVKSEE
ncbi:uncharacterized protein F5147DRAFT_655862 [Suillus discolor]|uniref:Uncharacterized protein n=1 Tax=Suillus discolor TaxID=1912936 RepID=A0A9P7JQL0_9AGAM|nr:uncharacterized protein F5147DRAFT_655862 [Suillus discolor]KAG2099263.1 hypothetical protein F5147DRAFT_655862 [Suillus discolor]